MKVRSGSQRYGRGRRGLAVLLASAVAFTACVADPTGNPVDPGDGKDAEIEALLADPDFVAQFGDSEEERTAILADIRSFLDDWDAWDMDPVELERIATEKAEFDRQEAADALATQARLDQEAKVEKARLDGLQNGPTVDDIAADNPERDEDFDTSVTPEYLAKVEGYTVSIGKVVELRRATEIKVQRKIDELTATGELADLDKIPGYVPDEGKGDSMYAAVWADKWKERQPPTGACINRAGNRDAPKDASLRPGTMYSPQQNTFAGTNGSPTYVGQLKTTTIEGKKHFIVEGHLGDLDNAGVALGSGNIWTLIRARLTVHTAQTIVPNYDGLGPYIHQWVPGTPIASGDVQVLCYYNDFGLPTGTNVRRAMYRAYIPFDPEGTQLTEPGFQVRAAVSEQATYPNFFYGADMRTVYLGQRPLGYNETFQGGGFGVSMGSGVIVDNNNFAGDDLESSIRGPVQTQLTSLMTSIEGTSDWVLGKKNNNAGWGWLGFHINNSAPTTPSVNIDWDPTKYAGANDDEYRLKGSISMNDWLIEGYMSLPWAAFGLIPCYFRMKVDLSATVYAAVDINNTAPTILQPDIEIGSVGIGVHNMFASPLPLGCNSIYLFKFADKWDDKINALLPSVNNVLANQVQIQPNIGNVVPASIPIGGGKTMNTLFAGWNDTCVAYGCNGSHAGDMAMGWAGLEATGDIRFTDTKPVPGYRRFPVSYSPTTVGKAGDRVRQHFEYQNEITDFGAHINPSLLNQALRVLNEQGRLDLNFDAGTTGYAKSPAVYLDKPIAPNKPLGIFLPHIEIDPPGPNLFAADVFAAVGVGFDSGTRKLVPAPIAPNDPGLGIAFWTLNCDGVVWGICNGVPALVSSAGNWAANTLLNPVLQNTVGQIKIPQTGNFSLTNLKVTNEDGHLGVRTSVGAPSLLAWGGINASTYSFDTYFEGLPGTGPVTYSWSIKDNVSGAVIFTATGPQWQYTGMPTAALASFTVFGTQHRSVTATINASRGGVTKTATHTNTL